MRGGTVVAQARATAMTATTLDGTVPDQATALPGEHVPGSRPGPVRAGLATDGPAQLQPAGSAALTVTDTRPAPA